MIRWLFLGGVGLSMLVVLTLGGSVGYLWFQGSGAMERAETADWLTPDPTDAPLSIFETMVAKVEFGETWNETGFPCRTAARAASVPTGRHGGETPVSWRFAYAIARDLFRELSLESQLRQLALSCLLETRYGDAQLLRLWMRRAYFGYDAEGAEAASRIAFNTAPAQLDQAEAARLVALLHAGGMWKDPKRWDAAAKITLEQAAKFRWDGLAMTRIQPGGVH